MLRAVAVYARAVDVFANQGAHLKVIAVGEQVPRLVEERVPVEAKRIAAGSASW